MTHVARSRFNKSQAKFLFEFATIWQPRHCFNQSEAMLHLLWELSKLTISTITEFLTDRPLASLYTLDHLFPPTSAYFRLLPPTSAYFRLLPPTSTYFHPFSPTLTYFDLL